MTASAACVPRRLQRRRTRGWRKPAGSVIVDRTSRWGNPFAVGRPAGPLAPDPDESSPAASEPSIYIRRGTTHPVRLDSGPPRVRH